MAIARESTYAFTYNLLAQLQLAYIPTDMIYRKNV